MEQGVTEFAEVERGAVLPNRGCFHAIVSTVYISGLSGLLIMNFSPHYYRYLISQLLEALS